MIDEYEFHFEEARLSGYQGPNNPAEEYFTGREPSEAVVRECIQNSLDARSDSDTPVRVHLELRLVATEIIPDIAGLRDAAARACTEAGNLQGAGSLKVALETAKQEEVWVLAVSDFGTRGLEGSEAVDDEQSPLSILTRGSGASSDQGSRGGSFGIGSAVGTMASAMSTVLYRTRRASDPDVIIAGYTRLASFHDANRVRRRGEGFLTSSHVHGDFKYMRNEALFPGFSQRLAPGTDVFILGYVDAAADRELYKVRNAVAANFFAAIDGGKLIVEGGSEAGTWTLDSGSLPEVMSSVDELRSEVLPFYKALKDPRPIVGRLPGLGEVSLHIYEDDTLGHPRGTWTMRSPLMKIDTFVHRIPAPYAAVLICADEPGNTALRKIEPPEHTKWNEKGPRSNGPLVSALKTWVRTGLRERLRTEHGADAHVRGLEAFLPLASGSAKASDGGRGTPAGSDEASDTESSRRVGEVATYAIEIANQGAFRARVRRPAVSGDGEEAVGKGKDRGGSGGKRQPGDGLDGQGAAGDGKSRIDAGDLKFRSFRPAGSPQTTVVLTPKVNASGDLHLATLGASGTDEENDLEIRSAVLHDGDDRKALKVEGMIIRDLVLVADVPNRIELQFSTHRGYRLGVKNA
ncbi:hypothetical protein [Pedococcus soli]